MINPAKKIGRYITDKIDKLLLAISGTACGLALAQFPQFLAQYIQRLGGHIDEAHAASTDYNLPELVKRVNELREGFENIANSPEYYKLPKFIINMEWDIAREASKHYTPGMTFDELGLYYLAAGLLLGLFAYGFIKIIIKKCFTGILKKDNKKNQNTEPFIDNF